MVYQENFIVCVKSDGKILRESNGYVTIPFGSEYSILLKNLDSRKAVVSISIDGKTVTGNTRIIVNPESSVGLEGKKENSAVRNKFKFIKKIDEIAKYRGDRVDDGIIRVEVTFEQAVYEAQWTYNDTSWHYPKPYPFDVLYNGSMDLTPDVNCVHTAYHSEVSCSNSVNVSDTINDDEGITVKGSKTDQKFVPGNVKTLESQSVVFTIKLRGTDSKKKEIKKPIFTKDKRYCETCGRKVKYSVNYCSNCGTHV